jgi:hypothetical protein
VVITSKMPASGESQTTRDQKQEQKKQPKNSAPTAASLTGCVDQQNGDYVLINDRTTELMASLEAVGFPQEGFAKHLGHKVTVKGTSTANHGRPVFQVRTVERVSEMCAP